VEEFFKNLALSDFYEHTDVHVHANFVESQ